MTEKDKNQLEHEFIEKHSECHKCKHQVVVDEEINAITGEHRYNVPFCLLHGVSTNLDTYSLCKQLSESQKEVDKLKETLASIYNYSVYRLEEQDDRVVIKNILLSAMTAEEYTDILDRIGRYK